MAGKRPTRTRVRANAHRKRGTTRTPVPPALQETDALYRAFFENANDACAVFTVDGIITAVNRGAERLLGWSREELRGQHVGKVATRATVALAEERSRRFLAGNKPSSSVFEAELVRKDGSTILVEARTRALRDSTGTLLGYQGIYRDITARKQAEAALRASEEHFRGLIEHATDMIVILAADGTVRYSSPSAQRVFGYSLATSQGRSGFDFLHSDDRSRALATFTDLLTRPGGTASMELRVQHQDGSWHTVDATATNLLDNAAVAGIVINARDISERKHMEEELRASEERYRTIFEACPDLIYLTDPAGRLLDANPTLVRWAGFSLEELRQKHFLDFFAGDNREELLQKSADLRQGIPVHTLVVKARNARGEVRDYEVNALPLHDQQGAITAVLSLARDITARKEIEQALRDSEERYRRFIDAAPDVIYTLAVDGTLTSLNPAFHTITGWRQEDWLHKPFVPILHPEDVPKALDLFQQVVQGHPLPLFELRVVTPSGAYLTGEFLAVPLSEAGQVTGVLGVSRDITDRKRTEAELQESQHLTRRIADTMPDILYLYDLGTQKVAYLNRQISALGYTPEEIREKDAAALRRLLHPEDLPRVSERYRQFVTGTEEELVEGEYRVQHANGEWRWFASRATVFHRAGDGKPEQILGVAQDITERKRLEKLLQEQVVRPADMPKRLRQFRESLGMTQPEFGRTFGGFNQRQISSYETGENDIPLELLLAIRARGYPVDAVLGTGPLETLEKTALYFSTSHADRVLLCQLLEAVLRLLTRDRDTIAQALQEFNLPARSLTRDEEKLIEDLANVEKQSR